MALLSTGWPATLAFVAFAVYANCLAQVVVEARSPGYRATHVLADAGFWLFDPPLAFTRWIDATASLVLVGAVLLVWAVTGRLFGPSTRRLVRLLGANFAVRALALTLSVLPPPLPGCSATVNPVHPRVLQALLVSVGAAKTCADVFFSGHAATMTTAVLVAAYAFEARRPPLWARTVAIALAVAAVGSGVAIVAARFHYAIDVVAGVFVANALFYTNEVARAGLLRPLLRAGAAGLAPFASTSPVTAETEEAGEGGKDRATARPVYRIEFR